MIDDIYGLGMDTVLHRLRQFDTAVHVIQTGDSSGLYIDSHPNGVHSDALTFVQEQGFEVERAGASTDIYDTDGRNGFFEFERSGE